MPPSPLLGYNHNVRHQGKTFHVQTEDSGVKYGHITTHLFAEGGRILKSVKTSYAEYVGDGRLRDIVREMMKQQHKAMCIALRDGKFDALADGTNAPAPVETCALAAPAPKGDVPEPPTAVLRERSSAPVQQGPLTVQMQRAPSPDPIAAGASERRYAPTRPASIFGKARPQGSIFGEDLRSDKSLDEVIRSYLADEPDGEGS